MIVKKKKGKITTESLRKFCQEKLREISKLSQIQKDSNFASLRGLNSHLSL